MLLIFATTICLVAALADLVVSGLDRPAWAIAPLAALFAVPALGLGYDSGMLSFACLALGYLAVLVADGLNPATAWNRGLSADSSPGASFRTGATGTRAGAAVGPVVWRAAGLLAAPAVVLALVFAVLLPDDQPARPRPGQRLRRERPAAAHRPEPRPQAQPQPAGGPGGVPLHDQPARRGLPADGRAPPVLRRRLRQHPDPAQHGQRPCPSRPATAATAPHVRTTRITSVDFSSQYLPAPYAARSFTAAGDWSYNSESLTIVNSDNRADVLTNLSYEVRSWDIAPTAAELSRAGAGAPSDGDVTGQVPPDLPQSLIDLSRQVTRGADTPYARAAAIQAYLRSPTNFTYDTQQRPGNGYQALVNFLTVDKRGYCEQFASAMAMMARVNGIPSRVAVGFLPGTQSGDTYDVSVRDMHAWPELYFAGYGWVRFEPTPGVQSGIAAGLDHPARRGRHAPSASAEASTAPSTAAPSTSEAPSTAPQSAPSQTTTTTTSVSWRHGRPRRRWRRAAARCSPRRPSSACGGAGRASPARDRRTSRSRRPGPSCATPCSTSAAPGPRARRAPSAASSAAGSSRPTGRTSAGSPPSSSGPATPRASATPPTRTTCRPPPPRCGRPSAPRPGSDAGRVRLLAPASLFRRR